MEYSPTAMLRNAKNVNDDNGEQNANNVNDNNDEQPCGICHLPAEDLVVG